MQLIRENIKFKGEDANIKINIGSTNNLNGNQDVINTLINNTSNSLINTPIDSETWKFKYHPNYNALMVFKFGTAVYPSYTEAGFLNDEMKYNSSNYANSFFIMDFYDSYDENNQNKLMRSFLTIKDEYYSFFDVGKEYQTLDIINNQISTLFVPQWVINNYTGNIYTIYVKFSFYNAKLGKMHQFYNNEFNTDTSSRKMYFEIRLMPSNKTWLFTDVDNNKLINAIELLDSDAYTYNKKINDSINKIPNLKQEYPDGNLFDYGKYTNLEE